jgi:hypothetical protein
MAAGEFALERFEAVARGSFQIVQSCRSVHEVELPRSDSLDLPRQPPHFDCVEPMEQVSRGVVVEADDHTDEYSAYTDTV